MNTFKVGDVVHISPDPIQRESFKSINPWDDREQEEVFRKAVFSELGPNTTGVIVHKSEVDGIYMVEWTKPLKCGHTCAGHAKRGYGYNLHGSALVKLNIDYSEDQNSEDDLL